MEKAREFQKNMYFCFIDFAKAFDCVDHKELWKILKEMGIPYHLSCLLRNLYSLSLPRLSSRGSTHTTLALGTALWKSLVGKPCDKASRKSH